MVQLTEDSIQQTVYIDQNPDDSDNDDLDQPDDNEEPVEWSQDDSHRLLTFYSDNRETFIAGTTKRKFLWSVACKTMLMGKTPYACEAHLGDLMRKYAEAVIGERKGVTGDWHTWPLLSIAQQVFHDDSTLEGVIEQLNAQQVILLPEIVTGNERVAVYSDVETVTKRANTSRSAVDLKVIEMLNLYLKHKNSLKNLKKDYWQRGLWESIAVELGNEEDAEYWHKRFLNFKHNYIRLLEKRYANGPESVHWPYMSLFDQIFDDDQEFRRKYPPPPKVEILSIENVSYSTPPTFLAENIWNNTEVTVLAKYYFDCFDEFQDSTIPKQFLWNEVGRLLDRNEDSCKAKYESLKSEHKEKYTSGGYNLANRIPLEIIFDNIIFKEIELELSQQKSSKTVSEKWKTEELDELVQFLCNSAELFKDPVCHYVCWAVVADTLKRSVQSCLQEMEGLVELYRKILSNKKENPDVQIEWRYIELFDRIYDYGMDEKLLTGYANLKQNDTVQIDGEFCLFC